MGMRDLDHLHVCSVQYSLCDPFAYPLVFRKLLPYLSFGFPGEHVHTHLSAIGNDVKHLIDIFLGTKPKGTK